MSYNNRPLVVLSIFTVMLVSLGFVKDSIEASDSTDNFSVEYPPLVDISSMWDVSIPETTVIEDTYQGEGGPEPEYHLASTTTTTTTTEVLRVWKGKIPEVYGEGSGCTQQEASIIARAFWDVGAFDKDVEWALGIISRESSCDSSAHNDNSRTRDDSWGLCQQNVLSGWFNEGKLLENYDRFSFANDFELNAESCALMWAECGRGPWNYGNYYCSTPKKQDTGLQ